MELNLNYREGRGGTGDEEGEKEKRKGRFKRVGEEREEEEK